MKKKVFLLFTVFAILLSMPGCTINKNDKINKSEKPLIVATLFPQYDFTREIVKDKADVMLLMPAGIESHTYEPTPSDIIKINSCDLFIYTGKYMESWAQSIIDGLTNKEIKILDVSQNIELKSNDEHEHENDEHFDEFDPHFWTDPINAKEMVKSILNSVCLIDPENSEFYNSNAADYLTKLDELDNEFRTIVSQAKRKRIIMGGRFALYYFAKRYDISYKSAFDNCSSEGEPSAKTVSEIIDEIKKDNIPVIFYEELSDPKVARSIAEETGAKMLLLHSCHNLSKEDFENGESYYSLMKMNAGNLKQALN